MKLTIWGVVMMSSKSAIIGSLVLILTVVSVCIDRLECAFHSFNRTRT